MDFEFLEPLRKTGFRKLAVEVFEGKITYFKFITKPRRIEALIQGELELRTEIHLTFGSDLITYGLDKLLLLAKELTGRGESPTTSTLKYDIFRVKPSFTEDEKKRLEALYYQKINAPIQKFLDALGPRVRKVREFIKDADEVVDQEVREVAAKEIVERIRKTSSDFGFDFDRISRRTGEFLEHMSGILGESTPAVKINAPEYQAGIRKKSALKEGLIKPQLLIIQKHENLQFIGGSQLDDHFSDISPELLNDALRRYLLTKNPKTPS